MAVGEGAGGTVEVALGVEEATVAAGEDVAAIATGVGEEPDRPLHNDSPSATALATTTHARSAARTYVSFKAVDRMRAF